MSRSLEDEPMAAFGDRGDQEDGHEASAPVRRWFHLIQRANGSGSTRRGRKGCAMGTYLVSRRRPARATWWVRLLGLVAPRLARVGRPADAPPPQPCRAPAD